MEFQIRLELQSLFKDQMLKSYQKLPMLMCDRLPATSMETIQREKNSLS